MREIKFRGNTYRVAYQGPSKDWQQFRQSLILSLRSMERDQVLTEHKGYRVFFHK